MNLAVEQQAEVDRGERHPSVSDRESWLTLKKGASPPRCGSNSSDHGYCRGDDRTQVIAS